MLKYTNLKQIRCFLLDMDGTVYLGNKLLSGSVDFIKYMQETGREVLFLTNNSSRNAFYYAEKLKKMGCITEWSNILTSGEATARYLQNVKPGAKVYLLGTNDLVQDMERFGLKVTEENPDFVVLGFDTTLTYQKLEKACRFIREKVPYIATHPDLNCPTEDGYIPDCGSMIALIEASTGCLPKIIGKPNCEIIDAVFLRKPYRRNEMAMVGDRLYTDIATAHNASITGILVLSGETKKDDLLNATVLPDYTFVDIAELLQTLRYADEN